MYIYIYIYISISLSLPSSSQSLSLLLALPLSLCASSFTSFSPRGFKESCMDRALRRVSKDRDHEKGEFYYDGMSNLDHRSKYDKIE